MSVNDRLGRLLFIVPYVAHRDGVPLGELAERLGVTPGQIEADLDLLAMVGQPPLTPDHLIDLYVEDDVVYVDLDQNLTRPLRLTHDEARGLVLAARLVGGLGGIGAELDRLVDRLLALLPAGEGEAARALGERIALGSGGEHTPGLALRRAVEGNREVRIDYYSVSSDRQKSYRLQPLGLISHTGIEYLLALDVDADRHEKLFRIDRMAEVVVLDAEFTPPDDVDLEKYRRQTLYFPADGVRDDLSAEVRFSPNVARVVQERFSDRAPAVDPEGRVTVRLNTSSPAWLARWVLPFGLDAEVLGPAEHRAAIAELCREAAAVYERDAEME